MPAVSAPVVNVMDGPSFATPTESNLASGESSRPFHPVGNFPTAFTALSASFCVVGTAGVAGVVFGAGFGVGFCCADPTVSAVKASARATAIVFRMGNLLLFVSRAGFSLQPFILIGDASARQQRSRVLLFMRGSYPKIPAPVTRHVRSLAEGAD